MKRMLTALTVICLISLAQLVLAAGDPQDCPGCKDPALFSRMPGFHIYNQEIKEFDRFEFPLKSGKTEGVEGRHLYLDYYLNEGVTLPSALQIIRNYANAVRAAGGRLLNEYEDGGSRYAVVRLSRGGTEAWALVEASGNGMYKLHIIERQAMKQEVVADAKSLAAGIRADGKAAVYGIYFDTGKAEIKPESDAAIKEIGKLLKSDGRLKLYVVGHTDAVGNFESNIRLSQARAAAVVNELVRKQGINAGRLKPFGAGPTSPVATNTTEEGRAKNRRVELVAQ